MGSRTLGIGHAGSLFALRYGAVGLGVLSSILWARYAPMEVFGQYQMVMALLTFVGGFCLIGMEESMTIAAAKRYDGNIVRLLRIKALAGALGALAVAGAGFYWRAEMPGLFVPTMVAACLFVPWVFTASTYAWLNGRGLTRRLFVAQFLLAATQVAALGIALWLDVSSTAALLSCIVAPQALLALVLVAAILRRRESDARDPASVRYGWHVSAAMAVTALIATDKLLLGNSVGPEEVAVYAVALLFPQQITTLYGVVNQMLVPDMYKADSVSRAWAAIKPRLPLIVGVFSLLGIAGFLVFPVLIPALFSAKYVDAVPYGKWLWLSLAVAAPMTMLTNILRAQQKIGFVYALFISQPVFQFVLYLLLLQYGIAGLVTARIITQWVPGLIIMGVFAAYLRREERAAQQAEVACAHPSGADKS